MNMQEVESSSIAAIGHFGTTLKVKFKNGATYVYENVTAELHKAIVEADSIGSFFAATIKKHPSLYPFKKVD